MAVQHHVRNPIEWGWDRLKETGQAIGSAASTMDGAWEAREMAPPVVRKIGLDDLRQALREGARDFGACRTDVDLPVHDLSHRRPDHLALRLRLRDAAADLPAGLGLRPDRARCSASASMR